jgi:CubicO group peptidase (beta-lactamase class C family)
VYRKAYGSANLELGVPLSPQSVFYMGSVAKQFTAAAVVLAAEQGSLSLDDDVRKYVPELSDIGSRWTGGEGMDP